MYSPLGGDDYWITEKSDRKSGDGEFEPGKDRAEYGSHLLTNLAKKLSIKGLDRTVLNLCRIFYRKYPQICDLVNHRLSAIEGAEKFVALPVNDINDQEICDSTNHKFETPLEVLISRLSFTHLREIMRLMNPGADLIKMLSQMRCHAPCSSDTNLCWDSSGCVDVITEIVRLNLQYHFMPLTNRSSFGML